MSGIVRVIVVMVFISLAAYGLRVLTHKPAGAAKPAVQSSVLPPRLTAQQAAHAATASTPGTATTTARLIYPGPAARRALHLGYTLFDVRADGSMMALPLPPGSAWQTMLALDPTGHRGLAIQPMGMASQCGFEVVIAVYRAGQAAPVWRGELPAHSPSARQVVDLSVIGAGNPLLVSLAMADGARNNWSCNVILDWDDAPPASP